MAKASCSICSNENLHISIYRSSSFVLYAPIVSVGIRQLQLILLKVALLLGVHVHIGVQFKRLILPVVNSRGQGKNINNTQFFRVFEGSVSYLTLFSITYTANGSACPSDISTTCSLLCF